MSDINLHKLPLFFKNIFTFLYRTHVILKEGYDTSKGATNVAKDIIGDLGDNAIEHVGKLGGQRGKVTGFKSADGSKGWRVDWDATKGAHINWWNGKEKGAVLFKGSENQVNQIINNEVVKSLK